VANFINLGSLSAHMRYLLLKYKKKDKSFLIRDFSQDFHSHYGVITKEQLRKAKPGETISTQTGKEFLVEEPSFPELFKKIKRRAQMIPVKDYSAILANTMVGKDSICLDAGTGSGALACFLARFVKKVITYDVREDHQKIARKNAEFLGLKNIEFRSADIFNPDEIDVKNIDLFTLDVTTPWDAIETADNVLKRGGYLVSYSPNLTQIARMVNSLELKESFELIKVEELIEREWEVKGDRILRPKMRDIAHSGFLIFAKKLQ